MLRHYFTLKKITEELACIRDAVVIECFSQEKNTLLFTLFKDEKQLWLHFSSDSQMTSLFLKENFARAKKNSLDLFPSLIGKNVLDVSIDDDDRIIRLRFDAATLSFALFGGPKSNAFITDSDHVILDSFKHKKELIQTKYIQNLSTVIDFFSFHKDETVFKALSKCSLNLGSYYADEVCERCSIDKITIIENNSEQELTKILAEANKLKHECLNSTKFYILQNDAGKKILSLIPLTKYPIIIKEFDSINKAVENKFSTGYSEIDFGAEKRNLAAKLTKTAEKLEHRISIIKDDTSYAKREQEYRSYAELLSCHPQPRQKFGDTISLLDFNNEEITIPLDSQKNLIENSGRYYDKARGTKEEAASRRLMLPVEQKRLDSVRTFISELEKAKTLKELLKIRNKMKKVHGANMDASQTDDSQRFRTFELGEGYTLYVGKNAANNDELTMKFARANDIWFHARGSGGSHVVLKLEKNQKPPKDIIKRAASVAAYYSQARNAKYTPVAYCQKKYVHKSKGAPPGQVTIDREEVVMVEPKLPVQVEG
ncbi:MAG: hypothetical protein HW421_136 [Ignavibacteria bacterium]|nr:hypothetical protein [Ignavibacteria bacterium]